MNGIAWVVGSGVVGLSIGIGVVSQLPPVSESTRSVHNTQEERSKVPSVTTTPSSSITTNPSAQSSPSLSELALAAIDDMAAHPEDLQNAQQSSIGVSDEELAHYSTNDIAELIEETIDAAQASTNPRYQFALGRAAWIHGDDEYAQELLTNAANQGSAAAKAYLGRMSNDPEKSIKLLHEAEQAGFKPAAQWLAEAQLQLQTSQLPPSVAAAPSQPQSVDFNQFSLPEVVRAFYQGNTQQYKKDPLMILTYISGVNEALSDKGTLFLLNNPQMLIREVDPNLGVEAGRKLTTNPQYVEQTASLGINMFKNMITSMAQVRQSGGSITEEVAAVNKALMGSSGYSKHSSGATRITIQEMKTLGTKDGVILAMLVDSDPSAFQGVYRNMIKFVRQQI